MISFVICEPRTPTQGGGSLNQLLFSNTLSGRAECITRCHAVGYDSDRESAKVTGNLTLFCSDIRHNATNANLPPSI
jgi:hypothetical protein